MNYRLQTIWLLFLLVLTAAPVQAMNIMKGFDGSMHTLEEYIGQGKWTIVMMWASDCHACNAEAKQQILLLHTYILNFLAP